MSGRGRPAWSAILTVAITLAGFGCATPKLDRRYGLSTGKSINGTKVFFDLLTARGHDVRRVSRLESPFARDAEVLVWAEKDPEGVAWFGVDEIAHWLEAKPDRVFLYLARDFDSDLDLWDDLARDAQARGESELEVRSRGMQANAASKARSQGSPSKISSSWTPFPFSPSRHVEPAELAVDLDPATPLARGLEGASRVYLRRHPSAIGEEDPAPSRTPETKGDSASSAGERRSPEEMKAGADPLAGRRDTRSDLRSGPPENGEGASPEAIGAQRIDAVVARIDATRDEVLLASSDGRSLVLRRHLPVGDDRTSAVILVHNGSFLLNYALLDPTNRTLAAGLADQLESQPRRKRPIVFFEPSRSSTSRVFWPGSRFLPLGPSPLETLFRPPFGWVFLHWLIVGLLYLAYRSPIFGRPRSDRDEPGAPFAQHVRAYGKLLERSHDRRYADTILTEYAQPRGGSTNRRRKSAANDPRRPDR